MTTTNHTTGHSSNNNNNETDDDDDIGHAGTSTKKVDGSTNHSDNDENVKELPHRFPLQDSAPPVPSKTNQSFRDNRQTRMAKNNHDKESQHHDSESVLNSAIDHDSMDEGMAIFDDEHHDGKDSDKKDDHADPNDSDSNGNITVVASNNNNNNDNDNDNGNDNNDNDNKSKMNKKNDDDDDDEKEEDGGDNESLYQMILAGISAGLAGLYALINLLKKCCCNNSDDTPDLPEPPK